MNDEMQYIVCPHCGNPECSTDETYCFNCGNPLRNYCTDGNCPMSDKDSGGLRQQMCFARIAVHNRPSLQRSLFLLALLMGNSRPAIRAVIPFPADFPAALGAVLQILSGNAGVFRGAVFVHLFRLPIHSKSLLKSW